MNIEDVKSCQICSSDFLTDKGVIGIRSYRKSFTLHKKYVCDTCYQKCLKNEKRRADNFVMTVFVIAVIIQLVVYFANVINRG